MLNNNFEELLNGVYNADCMEFMKNLPDNCIDLTVTSPPYGDLRTYKGFKFDFETIAKELYRITKDGGVIVWVVGDQVVNHSESGESFRQALYFKNLGFNIHDTMIYEKNGVTFPDKIRYYQLFEYMFIFSKGKPKTFNPIEDRKNKYTSTWGESSVRGKGGNLIHTGKRKFKEYGRRFNIWKYKTGAGFTTKDKIAFEHPAIYPEELARDHIISWSNPGDIVFDPMLGSGTTAKMSFLNKRNFLGCDISKEYVELSLKRLRYQTFISDNSNKIAGYFDKCGFFIKNN